MKDFTKDLPPERKEPAFQTSPDAMSAGDDEEILQAKQQQNAALAQQMEQGGDSADSPKGLPAQEPPQVSRGRGAALLFLLLALLTILAFSGWVLYRHLAVPSAAPAAKDTQGTMTSTATLRASLPQPKPKEEPAAPAPVQEPAPAASSAAPAVLQTAAPAVAEQPVQSGDQSNKGPKKKTLAERRLDAPLGFVGTGGTAGRKGSTAVNTDGTTYVSDTDNRLAQDMQPTPTPATQATVKTNPSLLLSKGTFIDCLLETAINTTVPGFTRCTIPRDIYSANGKVILIEKGSKITGEYRGAVQHGLARIFVLWTDIETPHGVSVALNSPGADNLGRAGLDGYVDYHWWARFGNALMFSLISDGFDFATAKATDANGGVNYYQNSQDGMQEIIREAMRQSGNIPPTLTKNQGERIGIIVSRDVRFDRVYRLEAGVK